MSLQLQPITFPEACRFIADNHRHHRPPVGWRFGIGVNDGAKVVGVITVGRPVARRLDDGGTLEVTRCCTDGTSHVASMLYGAAWRAAKALGYSRLLTYVLASEKGTSVRAAGWREIGPAGGGSWSRANRPRIDTHPTEQKTLWEAGDGRPTGAGGQRKILEQGQSVGRLLAMDGGKEQPRLWTTEVG